MSNPSFISGLNGPSGITFDSYGNLYVANYIGNTIGKYNSDGTTVNASFIIGLNNPKGIAFDSYGNLYVTNCIGNTIGKYNSDGTTVNASFIIGLNTPKGIAFDSTGNLYVANSGNDAIGKYRSDGSTVNADFIIGIYDPDGIAFDSYDNLYVVSFGNEIIGKYNSDGTTVNASFIIGLNTPKGIAFDSTGNLYVASVDKIGKYRSDGSTVNADFISGLHGPQYTAFDSAGNLYVTNFDNSKVSKYYAPPTISSIVPISGIISGGTSVTITGTNFVPNITTVKFGSASATSVNVNSSGTSITCFTPIRLAGTTDVVVTTSAGLATLTNGFYYVAQPTISSISPILGLIPGGTSVTITGTNFVPNITTVKFGSASATSVNVNSSRTSITCVTPNGLAGFADVVVTTAGFLDTLTNGFTYVVRLPISNICFPAGTPITTNQGTFPIEKINQAIHTIRNKKIVGITQTVTQDRYLVCFEKDSLGINLPSQKTIISKNHGIFYKGKMLHAKEFIGKFENVKKIKYTGEILYNVLMEDHDKMMVNNLICETLHPENGTAKLYKCLQNLNPKEQQNLIENCNEYTIKNNVFSSKKITN